MMNTESERSTVNFFLGDAQKKQLGITDEKAKSNSEIYIIIQNDKLQTESRDLHKELNIIKQERDQYESEADRADESLRYLRSLNKNLVELKVDSGKVCKQYRELQKNTETMNNKLSIFNTNVFYVLVMSVMTFTLTVVSSFFGNGFGCFMFLLSTSGVVAVCKFFLKVDHKSYGKLMGDFTLLKASCRTKLGEISRIEKEIKRTEESLPGIAEFIDNV